MQRQTRQIHVLRVCGRVQTTKYESQTGSMLGLDASRRTGQEELLKALVPETCDHIKL